MSDTFAALHLRESRSKSTGVVVKQGPDWRRTSAGKTLGLTQKWLRAWSAEHHSAEQSRHEFGEAQAAVKTAGAFGQIAPGLLVPFERVIGPSDGSFQVRQQYVCPACALQLCRSATALALAQRVRMINGKASKSALAIAERFSLWLQSALGPIGDRFVMEGAHRLDHGVGRMLLRFVGFHRNHKRLHVFRAAARLSPRCTHRPSTHRRSA
jgi:hypothetical protein